MIQIKQGKGWDRVVSCTFKELSHAYNKAAVWLPWTTLSFGLGICRTTPESIWQPDLEEFFLLHLDI